MHRRILAATLLLAASWTAHAQRIDRVTPDRGTPESETAIVVEGGEFEPLVRVDLLDGGPYEIARRLLAGTSPSIQVLGDRAYVSFIRNSEKRGGIHVFDVSDPSDPVLLGEYGQSDGSQGYGVAVEGATAFVGFFNTYTFDGGIYVVDLGDETDPRLASTFWDVFLPMQIRCRGDRLYVADLTGGLVVVDVADPLAPRTLSTLPSGALSWDVAVRGDTAYLADGAAGLSIVDLADPANPVLRARIAPVATPGPFDDGTLGVAVSGDLAFIADSRPAFSGMTIVDVSDPASPRIVGRHATPLGARSVDVDGDTAYVTDGAGGLQILDVSDPTAPRFLGGTLAAGFSGDFDAVDVKDGFAFVADRRFGLRVIDVRTPSGPAPVSRTPLDGASGLARRGDTAYAVGNAGLQIFDLADPADPGRVGSLPLIGGGRAIALSGDLAAVAGADGLTLVSVADPTSPARLGDFPTPDPTVGVALDGTLAAVVDDASTRFVDVSDPGFPVPLGRCDSRDRSCRMREARGVALANGHAFVAADFEGLHVVDLSNPTAPRRIATERTPHRATDVAIAGNLAYVAIGNLGVAIYDVSTPGDPVQIGAATTRGFAQGLSLDGSVLSVANGVHGVEIFDVSDPAAPHLLSRIDTAGDALDTVAADGHVWIADRLYGLWIARRSEAPTLERVDPERIEATVPAGYRAGSYHVVATNPDGGSSVLHNAFRVCPEPDFSIALVPDVSPGSGVHWSVELDGDAALIEDPTGHDAWLALPPAAAGTRVEFVPSRSPGLTVDLWESPATGQALAVLSGTDEAIARARWATIVESGRVPLAERDARSYGPFRLSRAGRRASNAGLILSGLGAGGGFDPSTIAGAPRRHVRLRIRDGVLAAAAASGPGADLTFAAGAGGEESCGVSASTSAVDAVLALCRSLAGSAADLRFECPVNAPGGAGSVPDRSARPARP